MSSPAAREAERNVKRLIATIGSQLRNKMVRTARRGAARRGAWLSDSLTAVAPPRPAAVRGNGTQVRGAEEGNCGDEDRVEHSRLLRELRRHRVWNRGRLDVRAAASRCPPRAAVRRNNCALPLLTPRPGLAASVGRGNVPALAPAPPGCSTPASSSCCFHRRSHTVISCSCSCAAPHIPPPHSPGAARRRRQPIRAGSVLLGDREKRLLVLAGAHVLHSACMLR